MKEVIIGSIKCPYCGFESEFKPLKTWRYRWWEVNYYEYLKCHSKLGFYVDPVGKRKIFTMKFTPRVR
jgi:hypothetical protein